MSSVSTHVLDTSLGRPASGVQVVLERIDGADVVEIGRGATDKDGRQKSLHDGRVLEAGTYRLRFEVGAYQQRMTPGVPFFPHIEISFEVAAGSEHYHVPVLLSPYGYSTYRGS